MAKLFANSGDPDQMPRSVASDLGLHCLPITFYGYPDYNGLRTICFEITVEMTLTLFFFYVVNESNHELVLQILWSECIKAKAKYELETESIA